MAKPNYTQYRSPNKAEKKAVKVTASKSGIWCLEPAGRALACVPHNPCGDSVSESLLKFGLIVEFMKAVLHQTNISLIEQSLCRKSVDN